MWYLNSKFKTVSDFDSCGLCCKAVCIKVWVFWQGHKIWKNLYHTFPRVSCSVRPTAYLSNNWLRFFKNKCGQVVLYKIYKKLFKTQNPRLINKSNFKSRVGYNGMHTVVRTYWHLSLGKAKKIRLYIPSQADRKMTISLFWPSDLFFEK